MGNQKNSEHDELQSAALNGNTTLNDSPEVPSDVLSVFDDYEKSVSSKMGDKSLDVTDLIFNDILKFDDDEMERVGKVLNQCIDIMKFDSDLPTQRLKDIFESVSIIVSRWDKQKNAQDWQAKIDPYKILKAKTKILFYKKSIEADLCYYRVLKDSADLSRRAIRSALSASIRQFSLKENGKKGNINLGDADNLGEMASAKIHSGATIAAYVYERLNALDRNCSHIAQDMIDTVNQIRGDMKASMQV